VDGGGNPAKEKKGKNDRCAAPRRDKMPESRGALSPSEKVDARPPENTSPAQQHPRLMLRGPRGICGFARELPAPFIWAIKFRLEAEADSHRQDERRDVGPLKRGTSLLARATRLLYARCGIFSAQPDYVDSYAYIAQVEYIGVG
jgi:hypothetical protein